MISTIYVDTFYLAIDGIIVVVVMKFVNAFNPIICINFFNFFMIFQLHTRNTRSHYPSSIFLLSSTFTCKILLTFIY